MKTGILYFNQGWTDIVNCLPLVTYYSKRYSRVILPVRDGALDFVGYYCRFKNNVECIGFEKQSFESNFVESINRILNEKSVEEIDFLFHGCSDIYRSDDRRCKFMTSPNLHFVSSFYQDYGIPFEQRIENFDLTRDSNIEDEFFESFTRKYGSEYVLVHDSLEMPINVQGVRLGEITSNPFISSKVLQNAQEIHLIDSFWASICYHLDMKFSLLQSVKVSIYPFKSRGGSLFDRTRGVSEPIMPASWRVVE